MEETIENLDTQSTENLNVRLPLALHRRLSMEIQARQARGLMVTKSDVVREALDRLLPVEAPAEARTEAV
jgi:Arc/MetJ-type ribon-helix-helix transcriptional regulator